MNFNLKADEPYLAASPDGVFSCSCGTGVLEKRPYKYKEGLEGSDSDASFCLHGIYELRPTHPYSTRFNYRCMFVNGHL